MFTLNFTLEKWYKSFCAKNEAQISGLVFVEKLQDLFFKKLSVHITSSKLCVEIF